MLQNALGVTAATLLSVATLAVASAPAFAQNMGDPMGHSRAMQPGAAAAYKVGDLVVAAPWIRATPKGAPVAGGYLKITNNGKEPDRLIGGSLVGAARFEVHEMTMDNGVMKMRPLANGLEIKPGQTVELKPGGYHIMFMDPKDQFRQGQTVKGTLQFAKAGKVDIAYQVGAMGGPAPVMNMQKPMDQGH